MHESDVHEAFRKNCAFHGHCIGDSGPETELIWSQSENVFTLQKILFSIPIAGEDKVNDGYDKVNDGNDIYGAFYLKCEMNDY